MIQKAVVHEDPATESPARTGARIVQMAALFVQAAEAVVTVDEAGEQMRAGSLMANNDKIV